jgi:hypothetical protein
MAGLFEAVRHNIKSWDYFRYFDNIPSIVWDIWSQHKRMGTRNTFIDKIQTSIHDGESLLARLSGVVASGSLGLGVAYMDYAELEEIIAEISQLMSRVHMAIANLRVRLQFVQSGMVDEYPSLLCPTIIH